VPEPAVAERRARIGAGRVLVLSYGFFTLAAGARSAVQLATKFSQAPAAYLLSAVAAVVYATGGLLVGVADQNPDRLDWARRLCTLELAGVIGVGLASLLVPSAFANATVWSRFGSGYAFMPLVLPVLALVWIHRQPGAGDQR
jgi:hypothetical protein